MAWPAIPMVPASSDHRFPTARFRYTMAEHIRHRMDRTGVGTVVSRGRDTELLHLDLAARLQGGGGMNTDDRAQQQALSRRYEAMRNPSAHLTEGRQPRYQEHATSIAEGSIAEGSIAESSLFWL